MVNFNNPLTIGAIDGLGFGTIALASKAKSGDDVRDLAELNVVLMLLGISAGMVYRKGRK